MASLLQNLQDQVSNALDHLEQIMGDMEDVIWGGTNKNDDASSSPSSPIPSDEVNEFNINDKHPIHDDDYNPLDGIAENIRQDIFGQQIGPQNFREHFEAFVSAINWKEPFVQLILAFHAIMILLAFIACKKQNTNMKFVLFSLIGGVIYFAENLNLYGAQHWDELGITQNYFDSSGAFMASVVCTPLMLIFTGMMFHLFAEVKDLMVQLKVMKIKQQQRKQKKS